MKEVRAYMTNKIRIETDKDRLCLTDNKICAAASSKEYRYDLSEVSRMVILTTDLGPFYDDMALAVDVAGDVIFIMSGHRCFRPFLFDEIGKALPVDFQKIIEASVCTENRSFEIYSKQI